MKDIIKNLIGLFVPVKWENGKWGGTLSVSGIPFGIVIVVIAVVVNLLL